MFTDPLLVTYGASASQFSFGLQDGSNPSQRASAVQGVGVITGQPRLTIGHQDSRENPDFGGSTRTVVSFSVVGSDTSTGLLKATPRVAMTITQPKTLGSIAEVTALLQALVSLLTGETDGSVAADAAVDTTVVSKLLNGEG